MSVRNRKEKREDDESDDKLTDDFSASENEKSDKDKDKDDIQNKNVPLKLYPGEKQTQGMRNVPIAAPPLSKQQMNPSENAMVRTIYTLLMLFAFVCIISAGPFYCALLIIAITAGIFREIINLKRRVSREGKIPYFIVINWYFFFVGLFYFYGGFLASSLGEEQLQTSEILRFMVKFHKFISFCLWIAGFLGFVLSLKQGYYRYQFRIFGWTHLTLLIVVAQTSVVVSNLYTGFVWFILPAMLVITNDIFAYVFGKLFGKTKLIDLSPNKTWEGFIGGFFSSLFFAFLFSYLFQMFPSLVCVNKIHEVFPFQFQNCVISEVFVLQQHALPSWFSSITGIGYVSFSGFQRHSLVLSLFASLIAPFGGFFASGFKRALSVKDFGQAIPGHGGITDRMDCQLLMGTFTYCYISYVVFQGAAITTIPAILAGFKLLNPVEQQQVLDQLLEIVNPKQQ